MRGILAMALGQTPSLGDRLVQPVTNISDFIWAGLWNGEAVIPFPPLAIILLGVGLWFMAGLRFYPITKLGAAAKGLFAGRKGEGAGEISPFAALSTALSGQVGTGNLAGVATAIALGGPGAIFWMWVTALFGMALALCRRVARDSLPRNHQRRGQARRPDDLHHDGHWGRNDTGWRSSSASARCSARW